MRRILAVCVCVSVAGLLVPWWASAQSRDQAVRLFNDAKKLQDSAQSSQDLVKAAQGYEHALKVFERLGDKTMIGACANNLGIAYVGWGQYEKAVSYYEKSLAMKRALRDRKGESSTLNNLGIVYKDWGQYEKAVSYYEKSLALAREFKDRKSEANAVGNLATVYWHWGRHAKALEFYEKQLAIATALKDRKGELNAMIGMGIVYKDWAQHDKAVSYYEKARAIACDSRNKKGEGTCLNNLGLVYADWGQYEKAVSCYEKSLAISHELRDKKGESNAVGNLGTVYWHWGQYPKALQWFEKQLAIATALKDRKGQANAMVGLGLVCADWNQYDKAVSYYEKSLAIARELRDRKGEGNTLNNLGNVYQNWGRYDEAVSHFEKALAIAREFRNRKGEVNPLNNLGNVYKDWGQHDKAVSYYEKSIAIARELRDRKGEANTLNNMGNVYKDWGQYEKAVSCYEKSLAIKRELGDRKGEVNPFNNLGNVYHDWGQYDKAVQHYEKSLAVARELRDRKGEGNTLNNLGNVYKDRGEYEKAVSNYEKSLAIARDLRDRKGEVHPFNNLGNVYKDRGDYEKAVSYYEKSLAIARELRDRKGEGNTLNNLGLVYQGWGQYEKAVSYYEKSLTIKKELRDRKGEATSLWNMGNTLAFQGDRKAALELLRRAVAINEEIKVPTGGPRNAIIGLYLDEGDIAAAEPLLKQGGGPSVWGRFSLLKGDHAKAREYYDKVLSYGRKSLQTDSIFVGHTGLGLAYERLGEFPQAAEHFTKAVELTEDLRSSLGTEQRETFLDVSIGGFSRTTPYEGLARTLLRMNRPVEALQQSEYTKARVFAEASAKKQEYEGTDVPEDIRKRDAQVRNQLDAASGNLRSAKEKGNQQQIVTLELQVREAKGKLAAHVEMLRKEYPLFAATRYPQPIELARTALKENERVLSYDVTDSGVIIYLTKGKILKKALFKPITRKELDALVTKFREPLDVKAAEELASKLLRFDFATGKKLADLLLADVLPELPTGEPLIIVPAECLGTLPFEMLVLNERGRIVEKDRIPIAVGAEFFGDRNPISYYQSITAATLARNFGTKTSAGNRMLVMCDPVFEENDPRLLQAHKARGTAALDERTKEVLMSAQSRHKLCWPRMELTGRLGHSLKKAQPAVTDLFEGFEATKATFMRQDLTKYRSIVFATHGYAGTDLGGVKEPVLVLTLVNQAPGENGFLRMTEVMGRKMAADVVALTACQSGVGKRISGEGTMGMGRAFQYAGAKSALMTLWSVAQESSVQLTERFFRHLGQGKGRLEALMLARNEIRKEGWDHPFFWACFILVGEPGGDPAALKRILFAQSGARPDAVGSERSSEPRKTRDLGSTMSARLQGPDSAEPPATRPPAVPPARAARPEGPGALHPAATGPGGTALKTEPRAIPDTAATDKKPSEKAGRGPLGVSSTGVTSGEKDVAPAGPFTVDFDVADGKPAVKLIRGGLTIRVHQFPGTEKALRDKVNAFTAAFQDVVALDAATLKRFDPDGARSLCAELLGPVLDAVPVGAPLRIVRHPMFAGVSFDALVVDGTPAWDETGDFPRLKGLTYLGDRNPISYARSAAHAPSTGRSPGADSRILLVADPVFDEDDPRAISHDGPADRARAVVPGEPASLADKTGLTFPRLALTGKLAASIGKLYPGRADLLTGLAASKQALTQRDLRGYSALVIATHGYTGQDLPGITEPVCILSLVHQPPGQDGFLRTSEAVRLKLNADLAVLLASQSGLGKEISGKKIDSMGDAFLDAGARSALVVLWTVSERVAVDLTERFLTHLNSGKTALEALRIARTEIRKAGYDHPFFWGPFALVGECE
ncbi:MAG: tetratricopeptide repeat protein [Thermodesulfobacteriota bacterium]